MIAAIGRIPAATAAGVHPAKSVADAGFGALVAKIADGGRTPDDPLSAAGKPIPPTLPGDASRKGAIEATASAQDAPTILATLMASSTLVPIVAGTPLVAQAVESRPGAKAEAAPADHPTPGLVLPTTTGSDPEIVVASAELVFAGSEEAAVASPTTAPEPSPSPAKGIAARPHAVIDPGPATAPRADRATPDAEQIEHDTDGATPDAAAKPANEKVVDQTGLPAALAIMAPRPATTATPPEEHLALIGGAVIVATGLAPWMDGARAVKPEPTTGPTLPAGMPAKDVAAGLAPGIDGTQRMKSDPDTGTRPQPTATPGKEAAATADPSAPDRSNQPPAGKSVFQPAVEPTPSMPVAVETQIAVSSAQTPGHKPGDAAAAVVTPLPVQADAPSVARADNRPIAPKPTRRGAATEQEGVTTIAAATSAAGSAATGHASGTAAAGTADAGVTGATASAGAASAAAPLAETAVARHLDLAKDSAWLDRLAHDIAQSADTSGQLRFTLAPERLGRLEVALAQSADGTSIRLTTETREAHRIVADAQPRLVAEARAQGLRVTDTSVDLGSRSGQRQDAAPQQGFGNQNGAGGGQPQRSSPRPQPSAPAPVKATVADAGGDDALYA